ncbi:hypothetical protein Bca4012_029134 [Brassica carinata]
MDPTRLDLGKYLHLVHLPCPLRHVTSKNIRQHLPHAPRSSSTCANLLAHHTAGHSRHNTSLLSSHLLPEIVEPSGPPHHPRDQAFQNRRPGRAYVDKREIQGSTKDQDWIHSSCRCQDPPAERETPEETLNSECCERYEWYERLSIK